MATETFTAPVDIAAGTIVTVTDGQFVGVAPALPAKCEDKNCAFVKNGPHGHDSEGYLVHLEDGRRWDDPKATDGETDEQQAQ